MKTLDPELEKERTLKDKTAGTEGTTTSLAQQIEGAYQRIGVTGAHRQIVVMILLGVFFDALEQNAVGITGPILRESWGLGATDIGLLNTMTDRKSVV